MSESKIIYAKCKIEHECNTNFEKNKKIITRIEPGKAYSADNFTFTRICKKDEIMSFTVRREEKEIEGGFKVKECRFDVTIYNEDDTEFIAEYDSEEFANCYTIIGDTDDLIDYLKSH